MVVCTCVCPAVFNLCGAACTKRVQYQSSKVHGEEPCGWPDHLLRLQSWRELLCNWLLRPHHQSLWHSNRPSPAAGGINRAHCECCIIRQHYTVQAGWQNIPVINSITSLLSFSWGYVLLLWVWCSLCIYCTGLDYGHAVWKNWKNVCIRTCVFILRWCDSVCFHIHVTWLIESCTKLSCLCVPVLII